MPIATPAQYRAMLDAAQKGDYAYPAINVTSLPSLNGALRAYAESKSDGIIQVSTGGGEFASGTMVKDMALGAIVLAEAAHILAERGQLKDALTAAEHAVSLGGPLLTTTQATLNEIRQKAVTTTH